MAHKVTEELSEEKAAIMRAAGLVLGYETKDGWTEVVHGIDFTLGRQQTLAIVGESGSGKSTVAKAIVKLIPIKAGQLYYAGKDISKISGKALLPYRKQVQMIFQDPSLALNPRLTVRELLREPLSIHFPGLGTEEERHRMEEVLESVQLSADILERYPSEFSGGQRQRLLLARALSVEPEVLVCDEPVSALDVSIQSRLLELLRQLKKERRLTLLFISHDLAVVQNFADEVIVMESGRIVERGPAGDIFLNPQHPYTRTLVEACPQF